jgi:hypothetical protein
VCRSLSLSFYFSLDLSLSAFIVDSHFVVDNDVADVVYVAITIVVVVVVDDVLVDISVAIAVVVAVDDSIVSPAAYDNNCDVAIHVNYSTGVISAALASSLAF